MQETNMKTLNIINKYIKLLEQDEQKRLDPTNVEDNMEDNPDLEQDQEQGDDEEKKTIPLTSEGEKYLIGLLVKAFAHSPSEDELKIIDSINQEYKHENPKEISDAIERLLDNSQEEFIDVLGQA